MHTGQYVFAQITLFLPQRQFRRIVSKYRDRTEGWGFSHWSHLLVLMFGQLIGCGSLRELTDITTAHAKRSYNLGFGATPVVRNTLSKANMLCEPRIFEEFALYMVSLAQRRRIPKEFELLDGEDMLDGEDGVLLDQTIRFTGKRNAGNYPAVLRRIVYYAADLGRFFVYYTNNFYLAAKDIALLYRYRWQVELFFKWIKQHLRVMRFWGDSENAVRIQIHVAIITYCLVAIIEHDLKLDRPVFEVMRILGSSLLVKDDLLELFNRRQDDMGDTGQLELNFKC